TGMSLALVFVSANSYKKIKEQTDYTFNTGALVSYVENKIHNYDNGHIEIFTTEDDIDVLVLNEDNMMFKTYVYCYNGKMYENLVRSETEFKKGKGEKLYDAEAMSIKYEKEDLIRVNLCVSEDDTIETFIKINSEKQ
nr:DUF4860 domain-containing protein [Lachnospiraceae bacterium]